MKYTRVLITGGAGFVGSNLAIKLKQDSPRLEVVVFDNLKRRGSELNVPRLKETGITFLHGDIRNPEDFEEIGGADLLIECSAEPSVMAGINSSPRYLTNTNLVGTINCLEFCRKYKTDIVFLSTSRVYPIAPLNALKYKETKSRFVLKDQQKTVGASKYGIAENFPLTGARSLYGATKLCSELMVQEYASTYGLKAIIDRCGVITGPWQMGKVDQGVFVLWVARHIFGGKLSYIGFGGQGKQVRDFIHIDDLYDIIEKQISRFDKYNQGIYNIGGGVENSCSLAELTTVCQKVTEKKISIGSVVKTRPADLKCYITDARRLEKLARWEPKRNLEKTVTDIAAWINEHYRQLRAILG